MPTCTFDTSEVEEHTSTHEAIFTAYKHVVICKHFQQLLSGCFDSLHYSDVIMNTMASQITRPTIVYSTIYSGADQRKHQKSKSLSYARGIHRCQVNCPVKSPHVGPVTRKISPFDDVIVWIAAVALELAVEASVGKANMLFSDDLSSSGVNKAYIPSRRTGQLLLYIFFC